ncbi:MAG: hypothetical protein A3E07_02235 [Candidatus Wildermuthbacteria bacterium RIFCSPHIGHO2_12_FULL_45_9]|uniref:DUF86 domain-containing protein n=1 Tax=Candidatus Wildermuthbacteria bacterium RIFCSPHIGHO2_02_FULL_45_25 TaxID=1802450 RepID=A0A1G2QZ10_9BACT|nr:MAG: hypothetical protein A3C04_00040 [Candidatus Wildermuthbacteria bacterium RIFCSPHIGHO2_02_FULL_45_25]OHA70843.1 MAG: hypothetical protein A3E07_02235 [Candidatus Wildermuthbacteria bacterium RIFCSPHIGHO2_12_FULL_45_9]
MTSLSRQKILEKLQHLQEYIEYLHTLQKECSAEQSFVSDFHLFGNTERYLQLSIQAIIDASHLLILNLGFKRPTDNYEAVSTLFEKNILADDLAHAITRMIGLRNLLVHEYGQIDRKKIFHFLQHNLKDIEAFRDQISSVIAQDSRDNAAT